MIRAVSLSMMKLTPYHPLSSYWPTFFFLGGGGGGRHLQRKKNPAFAWSRMELVEQIAHVMYPCPFQPYLTSM